MSIRPELLRLVAPLVVQACWGSAAGQVVGVEVKAMASVHFNDLSGLRRLADLIAETYMCGYLLYDGSGILPMGARLWAVHLATLWQL